MKVNAISYCKNISQSRNVKSSKYYPRPSFSGVFDVFKKQKQISEEQQIDINIKKYLESAKQTDKSLKKSAKCFSKQLNFLLLKGKRKNYKESFSFVDMHGKIKTFSFSDVDKNMNIPSAISKWEDGQLKTTFEISSDKPLTYQITDYGKNAVCEYYFIKKTYLGYCNCDNDGQVIKQYASKNGFFQQRAKITNGRPILQTELYYDYKKPEESFCRENTSSGVVEYGYDKNKNFWSERRIISQEEYDEKYSE